MHRIDRVFFLSAIAAAVILIAMGSAHAGTANLSWTSATSNTDGSAIPLTCTTAPCGRLVSTTVEYGTCGPLNAFGVKAGEIVVPVPALTTVVNMVVVQTYCFRALHRNDYNEISGFSAVAFKVNSPPIPAPPGSLTIASTTVYQVVPVSGDRFAFNAVGTVPADTQCDPSQTVNGRAVVPRAAVTWFGSARPQTVVAQCS